MNKQIILRRSFTAIAFLAATDFLLASFASTGIGQSNVDQKPDFALSAQEASYSEVGRGPNEKVWSRLAWETNEFGIAIANTNSMIIELASGMHYLSGDEWMDSQDLIELTSDGRAAAIHGPCKAYFEPNLNTRGAITLVTANGRIFKTQPVALFYYDSSSGQVVRLATLKDCVAELLPPNQIVWKDVLDNVRADLRVTYTKAACESDLILLENPAFAPEDFGLNPATTKLELWHWWEAPSAPQITPVADAGDDDDFESIDSLLNFGDLFLANGRAFPTDGPMARSADTAACVQLMPDLQKELIPVVKSWHQRRDENTILVESVAWKAVASKLAELPAAVSKGQYPNPAELVEKTVALEGVEFQKQGSPVTKVMLSKEPYTPEGFVLDWITISGSYNGYQFSSGTYYLSGQCIFASGYSVTFQSGAFLKLESTNASVYMYGQISCQGSASAPTILTTRDDDLYGEMIPGSRHILTITDCHPFMAWTGPNLYPGSVKGLKIRGANTGIVSYYRDLNTIKDCSVEVCKFDIVFLTGSSGVIDPSTAKRCSVTIPGSDSQGHQFTDVCSGDSDLDNLPDSWEYQNFGGCEVTPTADSDGDGVINSVEWANNWNPTTPPEFYTLPQTQVVPQGSTVSLSFSSSVPNSQQWYRGSSPIAGATGSSLTWNNVGPESEDLYAVRLTCLFNPILFGSLSYTQANAHLAVLDSIQWGGFQWFIGRTNAAWSTQTNIWQEQYPHTHPQGWPIVAPALHWNTSSLLYNCPGFTGLSPCNSFEGGDGAQGQVPVTLLTRRHAYLRGHGVSTNGVIGGKVFFYDANSQVYVATNIDAIVAFDGVNESTDYTLLLFSEDVPSRIASLGVGTPPLNYGSPYHVFYSTCQHGIVQVPTYTPFNKHAQGHPGDGGSPIMVPVAPFGALVFIDGVDTAPVSSLIQSTMNTLSARHAGVFPYQMSWAW